MFLENTINKVAITLLLTTKREAKDRQKKIKLEREYMISNSYFKYLKLLRTRTQGSKKTTLEMIKDIRHSTAK